MTTPKPQSIISLLLAAICLLFSALSFGQLTQRNQIDIGVLAIRGNLYAQQRWQPTMEWLNQQIPDTVFILHPLDLESMAIAVQNQTMDFILTNPGQAVRLGRQFELSWLATLNSRMLSSSNDTIGSAVVVHRDSPFKKIEDLAGRPMAAVSERAFGGYLTLRYQVLEMGINPNDFFANVSFLGFPIDANLYQLRDNIVEAAVVPVCLLETMQSEGLLEPNAYWVINVQTPNNFPCQVSTRLYPNWSFAKTERASSQLAKQVTRALFAIPESSDAAISAGASGWTSPVSLLSIDRLYQALDLHPFQEPWWKEAFRWLRFHQEWAWAVFIFIIVLNAYHFWLEYRFSKSKQALELTQTRLKEKSAQLEHSQRVAIVDELGSSLAHEINQPLAAIRNYSEGGRLRLSKNKPADEIMPVFDKIQKEVDRADSIINRLRNLIKKRSIEKQPNNIENLITDTLELMHYRLQKHNVEVVRHSQGDIIAAEIDAVGMQQVLVNIINNSIDACISYHGSKGLDTYQPQITLKTEYHKKDMYIHIIDNGTGLNDADTSNTFVSTKEHGLGLGLAICRDVMETHHGQMQLKSTSPHGCKVTLSLPYF